MTINSLQDSKVLTQLEPKPKDVDETHPVVLFLAYRVRGDSIWGTGILQNAPEQHCSSSIASEVVEF